jgi:hypothetical protein
MQPGCDSDHEKNYASAEEGDSEREGEIGPRDEMRGVVNTHQLNLHNIAVRQPGVNKAQERAQVGNNAPSHSDLNASFVINIPEETMTAPPRLVGTDTLPKLNVKAADMKSGLERAFDKYKNFFMLNYIKSGAGETATERELKASILRQYIGDAAMDGKYPLGRDRTKTYKELKRPLKTGFILRMPILSFAASLYVVQCMRVSLRGTSYSPCGKEFVRHPAQMPMNSLGGS